MRILYDHSYMILINKKYTEIWSSDKSLHFGSEMIVLKE